MGDPYDTEAERASPDECMLTSSLPYSPHIETRFPLRPRTQPAAMSSPSKPKPCPSNPPPRGLLASLVPEFIYSAGTRIFENIGKSLISLRL